MACRESSQWNQQLTPEPLDSLLHLCYNGFQVENHPNSCPSEPGTTTTGLTKGPATRANTAQPASDEPIFPLSDPPQTRLCSYNECLAGHQFPAVMLVARCPGCTGSYLALQKAQCPICNEPVVKSVVRSDFVPRGAGASPRCKGATPQGESADVELLRTQWRTVEATNKDFLTREAEERKAFKS